MTEMSLGTVSEVSPRYYVDPEILMREQGRVFARHWQFVGFTDELAQHNDFVTAEIGGRSILVHNFDGILRGFHNVCSHRHARIHGALCGNGFLKCRYHGWTYNAEGVPVGIPGNARFFALDDPGRRILALTRVTIASHGRFVFARLSAEGPDLAAALGDYAPAIEEISQAFTDPVADCTVTWTANWKIAVETAMEVYHASLVHPETVARVTPRSLAFDSGFAGPHSFGHLAMAEDGVTWWESVGRRLKLAPLRQYTGFDQYHLFPNTTIALSCGSLMCLQTYEPIDANSCRLRYRLRMARGEGPQNPAVRKAVVDALRAFNRQVVEEDVAITTTVQQGVAQATRPALLGHNEQRLAHFQKHYLAEMAS
jgi:choline monooxygenase